MNLESLVRKTCVLCAVVFGVFFVDTTTFAREVPYQPTEIFLPQGFDDNDVITIYGTVRFRNLAYKVASVKTHVDYENQIITVENFAKLPEEPYAGGEAFSAPYPLQIPVHLETKSHPTPEAGWHFKVKLAADETNPQRTIPTTLPVARAENSSIDDYQYAQVTKVYRKPNVNTGASIVNVRIFYSNSCMQTSVNSAEFIVEKTTPNMIEIRPRLINYPPPPGIFCLQVTREETLEVDLEKKLGTFLDAGTYWVHVRSMNGMNENEIVEVEARRSGPPR